MAEAVLVVAWNIKGTLCRSLIAFGTTKFSWIMAIMLATEVLFGPSNIIADAVVVGSLEDSRDYGQLRAYGAIGWGLFALIGGSVISTYVTGRHRCYLTDMP